MNELAGTLIGMVAGLIIALVLLAIVTLVFRWLWNTTMPDVFGVKELSFGQAVKILILAGILFGGHRVADVPKQVAEESAPASDPAVQPEKPPVRSGG